MIIAILSLTISAFVAFDTHLSPPNIKVIGGPPTFCLKPRNSPYFSIIMTVSISNSGAQEGVLEDLVLLVRTKRQDVNWFLVPGALVDEEKFLKPPPNPDANWMKGFFHPLKLDGKHAEVLTVFFVVDPQHLLNRPLAEIPEGGLTITILSRELGSHDWKEQHRIFSGFNQKSLENIRSGQDTYITTAEQSDEERKNIH